MSRRKSRVDVQKWMDDSLFFVNTYFSDDDLDAFILRLIRVSKLRELKDDDE